MIKGIKAKAKQGKAVKISATFKGSVENYALAWLHLTNNAREFPEIFLKHYNNSGNGVFVITPEKYVEKMKEYLTGFNTKEFTVKVWDEEPITTITPVIDWGPTWGPGSEDIDWDELENAEVLPYEDAD